MARNADAGKAVTRADVARYAGVSTAVVSYVVNDGPKRVAPDTALRVRDAIRTLDYRPNATARALKTGSSRMLGLIIPDNRNPLFAELAFAVEVEAEKYGYELALANSADNAETERKHLFNLSSRQVDGLLIAPISHDRKSGGLPLERPSHSAHRRFRGDSGVRLSRHRVVSGSLRRCLASDLARTSVDRVDHRTRLRPEPAGRGVAKSDPRRQFTRRSDRA